MNLFASDLDRTLIYSQKMVELYGVDEKYESVEQNKGKDSSFMTIQAKASLKRINKKMLFVPVTTRTWSQYSRIFLFKNEIFPTYVITANGGMITKDGEELIEWTELIKDRCRGCLPISEVKHYFELFSHLPWLKEIREAEKFFVYLIIDEEFLSQKELKSHKTWAKENGLQLSVQGRKLYVIPKPINKWSAVQFLCAKLGIEEVYSAGDSLLDVEMIHSSHFGLAPAHGEVIQHYPALPKTSCVGLKAANEITEAILSQSSQLEKNVRV